MNLYFAGEPVMRNLKILFLVFLTGTLAACAGAPVNGPEAKVSVQWLGHAAFRITSVSGKTILIDPFITGNPKLAAEQKDLAKLGKVDLILVTHGHGDHVGDGPALARQHNAPLYAPPGLTGTLVELGELPKELAPRFNKGGVVTPLGPGIKIIMTRAEHSSEYQWTNPKTGQAEMHVGGEPAGFIIELENGFRIYHMGDTGLFGDMRLIADLYKPDLVLIPVGGHFVMSPQDAARATKRYFRPRYAIPMHYGTNPFLTGTPAQYKEALGFCRTRVLDLKFGETVRF
jgi:L-ascorbate metabolism protein UlaG (beta-lactamase superfamily)